MAPSQKSKEYVIEKGSQYTSAEVNGKTITPDDPVDLTEEEVATLEGMGVSVTEASSQERKEGE